jgi:hypothetical protein
LRALYWPRRRTDVRIPHPPQQAHRIEFDVPWPPHTVYAYLIPAEEPVLVDAGAPGEDG